MASVPYAYDLDRANGFVMDPNEHKRVGYVTKLDGFGLTGPLPADLRVNVPFSDGRTLGYAGLQTAPGITGSAAPLIASVVGVMEKWEWDGTVGGPIKIDFYCSQENATRIKTLQQLALKTTNVKALGWWICDYDQETKTWYEAAYPKSAPAVTGIIMGKDNPELNVDLTPVPVKDGIEVNVYKVSIAVVPGANQQYALDLANSSTRSVAKSWGLIVGSLGALKPGVA
jgi:hypothetical protein